MRRDQHLEDSSTLAARERKEYYKQLDKIEGIVDDDDDPLAALENIPDSTQRLLLRNYHAMMNMDDSEDPIQNLLQPTFAQNGYDDGEDWSSLYQY